MGAPIRIATVYGSAMDAFLRDDVANALVEIRRTGVRDLRRVFDAREVEPEELTPAAAYACGVVDGVARALGLTVLELLDALDLNVEG